MTARLRLWGPVAVVLIVLAGGYLLSSWLRGRDGDGSDVATTAAEKTAAKEEAATRSTTAVRTRTAAPTAPTASSTGTRAAGLEIYDLERDEDRGGHTIERHVGRTVEELRQRLRDEPDISAASTYTDLETASRTVALALAENRRRLSDWEKAESHPNLVLRVTAKAVVGRSFKRGDSASREVKAAVVVLKWSGRGWFVLTSYPEAR